jgi:hypothetical protein
MSNVWENPKLIARKALARLKNDIVISPHVDRTREVDFTRAKHGATMPIKRPVRFEAKAGRELVLQNIEQNTESIIIDQEYHVGWPITAYERSLNEDAVMRDFITPAIEALGAQIEGSITTAVAEKSHMYVGTADTTPANYAALSAVDLRMTQNAIPLSRRHLALNPKAHNTVSNAERTLNLSQRVESQLKSSMVNPIANFQNIVSSNHVKSHTAGGFDANYTVDGANQTGTSLVVADGAGTFLKGDVFTIAGVNAVNPETGDDLGFVQEFTVTADYAGGAGTISISPEISATLPYKTVSALPADDAAITGKATHVVNFGWQEDGISLVMIPEEPSSNVKAFNMNWKGFKFLVTYGHDMKFNTDICRIDALWGVYIDKRKVVRLAG